MLGMMCVTWRSEPATLARAKTCRAGAGRREGVSRGLVLFAGLLCASAAAAGRGGTNAVHATREPERSSSHARCSSRRSPPPGKSSSQARCSSRRTARGACAGGAPRTGWRGGKSSSHEGARHAAAIFTHCGGARHTASPVWRAHFAPVLITSNTYQDTAAGLIGHEPGQKTTSRNGSVSCYPTLLPSPKHS